MGLYSEQLKMVLLQASPIPTHHKKVITIIFDSQILFLARLGVINQV
jgi:hypothetical protein